MLLDLNVPGVDGRTVLNTIKSDADLMSIPVLILTSSPHPDDVRASYRAGANSYLLKPDSLTEFEELIDVVTHYWLGKYSAIDGHETIP